MNEDKNIVTIQLLRMSTHLIRKSIDTLNELKHE